MLIHFEASDDRLMTYYQMPRNVLKGDIECTRESFGDMYEQEIQSLSANSFFCPPREYRGVLTGDEEKGYTKGLGKGRDEDSSLPFSASRIQSVFARLLQPSKHFTATQTEEHSGYAKSENEGGPHPDGTKVEDKAEKVSKGDVYADVGNKGVEHDNLHVGQATQNAGADSLKTIGDLENASHYK